ncbi:MAG: hypothetical protein NWE94_09285 [Candidatus Bathyarchaeota archaeon]|nr:hypothetical protein [Candidatus Bathyarchaeota archaeon]
MDRTIAYARKGQNQESSCAKMSFVLKTAVVGLALLLLVTAVIVVLEHAQIAALQNEIDQCHSTIVDRDILITQFDTALKLAQSRLSLKLPTASRYLTTTPSGSNEAAPTKIFLISTSVGYYYSPSYPFKTPWFSENKSYFSSRREFELTNNRSLMLSFFGWTFDAGDWDSGEYGVVCRDGDPYLVIALVIRNDYTAADAGNDSDRNAPIGKIPFTDSYVSTISLTAILYSRNGSIIQTEEAINITTTTVASPTAIGNNQFSLGSGQTKQVTFYLVPSSLDIDHYEIYVSYLSAYHQP